MRDTSTRGTGGFLFDCILNGIMVMLWYRRLLFRCLPGMTYHESRMVLWAVVALSVFLSTFVFFRYRKTGWNSWVCLLLPFGLYTVITYWETKEILIKASLVAAVGLGVLGCIFCLFRRIKKKERKSAGKILKNRLYNCFCFFQSALAIGMLVIILSLGLGGLFDNGILHVSDVKATVGTESEEQTIENNIETVKLLQQEEWEKLSTDEKMNVIQCVANIESRYLGLPQELNVEGAILGTNTLACYIEEMHMIQINIDHLETAPAHEILNSVCHEARHGYQHCLVDVYNHTDETYRNLQLFHSAQSYAREFDDYVDGYADFYSYYAQDCEEDSRQYAEFAVYDYYEKIDFYLNN